MSLNGPHVKTVSINKIHRLLLSGVPFVLTEKEKEKRVVNWLLHLIWINCASVQNIYFKTVILPLRRYALLLEQSLLLRC